MNVMKKLRVIALCAFAAYFACIFPPATKAASEAVFTVTSAKTNYAVGDDIQITLNVDAGDYKTTLSVIDFDLKVSDTSVAEVKNASEPFVPGSIYSVAGIQGVEGDIVNAVTYINASSKPSSRSGVIGTINFKALKAGSVTFSYDRIEAAEESKEDDYVTTSASSLTVTIGSTVSASSAGASSTSSGYYYITPTPTAKSATTAASDTSTGPEAVILLALLGGGSIFFLYKIFEGSRGRV